ncbi:MAG: family 43 glycosylhydrolase [Bacteroidales bacterium]|nr:family 43 glycosylhydrolase [Bacteroidales bacterium]
MILKRQIAALTAVFTLLSCAQLPPAAHDPVCINEDGTWYLFSTGMGVNILSSTDCKKWEEAGQVFETAPQWALESVPSYRGHTWAPDISLHNGKYYLYYSCSSFGKNDSAIGLVTNETLNPGADNYRWEDQGPVVRSEGGRDNYNAIDPNLFVDEDGTPWLSFGSFWGGVQLVQLDSTLSKTAGEPFTICTRPEGTLSYTQESDDAIKPDPRGKEYDPGNNAVEAPFIVKRGDYYYLFVSYDLCCRGPKSTYKVVCGRAQDVTGPYLDKDGTPLLEGGGTLVLGGTERYPGVGHCAVVESPKGDMLFFHAYDKKTAYNAHLMIRPINWTEQGWPIVKL